MPLYPEYLINEIAEKNDIREVVSKYVTLKKAGSSYVGLCPFHNEKTPSFSVSPQKGIFHCFGCGAGGNSIHFLMKIENIPFTDAVKRLAESAGVALPEPNRKDSSEYAREAKKRERMYELNRAAADFFYESLKGAPAAAEYFKHRGLDGAAAKKFFLGYSPDSWNSLFDNLKSKGYTESEIMSVGLIKMSENGKHYDTFRNRVMFPIFDTQNRVIGFGGRVLDDSKPKYLNSPDSPVFNKSRNLYFLNVARRTRSDFVILVEGYMDVISLAKSGYMNTVATLGTALTEQQARMIAADFKEVVICYDSDEAGRKATSRAIGILRSHDVKISVLNLRDKKDPDEYINAFGITRFNNCIEKRKSDMAYLMDYLELKYDVTKNEDKVAFVGEMLEFFRYIKNPVELDVYAEELAARTGVSSNAIYSRLGVVKAVNKPTPSGKAEDITEIAAKTAPHTGDAALERTREYLLGLLLSDKELYKRHRDSIVPELFESHVHRELLKYIRSYYDIDKNIDPGAVVGFFTAEDDINEVSKILSLDNRTDDGEKAFRDYLHVIRDRMNKNKILKLLNTSGSDNIEKINDIIKKK